MEHGFSVTAQCAFVAHLVVECHFQSTKKSSERGDKTSPIRVDVEVNIVVRNNTEDPQKVAVISIPHHADTSYVPELGIVGSNESSIGGESERPAFHVSEVYGALCAMLARDRLAFARALSRVGIEVDDVEIRRDARGELIVPKLNFAQHMAHAPDDNAQNVSTS